MVLLPSQPHASPDPPEAVDRELEARVPAEQIEAMRSALIALTESRPGIAGHTHPAGPTAYRMREGSHVDPDGNLIRFGSPQQD